MAILGNASETMLASRWRSMAATACHRNSLSGQAFVERAKFALRESGKGQNHVRVSGD
jgi:quinol monooxygenase YgiN